MTFGQILKKFINDSDTSVRLFSVVTGLNRGWLYNIFNGKKPLPEDKFHKLLVSFPFSEVQKQILSDAYYEEVFGVSDFAKIKYMIEELKKLSSKESFSKDFPTIHNLHGSEIEYVNNNENLMECITFLLENLSSHSDSKLYTNYCFSHEEIDSAIYSWIIKRDFKEIFHIVHFENNGESPHNLRNIFHSLKYAKNKINTYYYYDNNHPMQMDNIFPFFIITNSNMLLYDNSLSSGLLISNRDIVNNFINKANTILSGCSPLVMFPDSVFHLKEYLAQNINYNISNDDKRDAVALSFEPCLTPYLNLDIIDSIAKSDIPHRNFVVQSLVEWLSATIPTENLISIHTPTGLRKFAEDGIISYFPSEYASPVSKEDRIKILNNCTEENSSRNSFNLLDENKMVLPTDLKFELSPNNTVIIYGTFDENDYSYTGEYIIAFSNNIMVQDFYNLKDYILRNHLTLNSQYTNLFLKELVLKLQISEE